jgi:hypothetical protein
VRYIRTLRSLVRKRSIAAMEHAHAPGCDMRHNSRERCKVQEPVLHEVSLTESPPGQVRRRSAILLPGPASKVAAIVLEILPGISFVLGYFVGVNGHATLAGWLIALSLLGGVGWLAAHRFWAGCGLLFLRGIVTVALFETMVNGFTNESGCYRMLYGVDECYRRAVRDYHVVLAVFVLMPFVSTALLAQNLRSAVRDAFTIRARADRACCSSRLCVRPFRSRTADHQGHQRDRQRYLRVL